MLKDRMLAHQTPQLYAQEKFLVVLFSLEFVLALPWLGA